MSARIKLAGVASIAAALTVALVLAVSAGQAGPPTRMVGSGAADPSGGPPWALRGHRSADGRLCLEVGRARDGRFGDARADGKVSERDTHPEAGMCVDPDAEPAQMALNQYPAADGQGQRTVLFGVVDDPVGAVRVTVAGREHRPPVSDGAFVLAFDGRLDPDAVDVHLELKDGRVVARPWR